MEFIDHAENVCAALSVCGPWIGATERGRERERERERERGLHSLICIRIEPMRARSPHRRGRRPQRPRRHIEAVTAAATRPLHQVGGHFHHDLPDAARAAARVVAPPGRPPAPAAGSAFSAPAFGPSSGDAVPAP